MGTPARLSFATTKSQIRGTKLQPDRQIAQQGNSGLNQHYAPDVEASFKIAPPDGRY